MRFSGRGTKAASKRSIFAVGFSRLTGAPAFEPARFLLSRPDPPGGDQGPARSRAARESPDHGWYRAATDAAAPAITQKPEQLRRFRVPRSFPLLTPRAFLHFLSFARFSAMAIATASSLSTDYLDRFGGVGRLFGRAGLERLAAAHVCVIGVGGVGSWTVEALARSGIGALTLIDLDDVCITNTNRQLPALEGQIGRPKIAVLAERVLAINPACRVTLEQDFFTAATAERLLAPDYSFVVDAIDRVPAKSLLIARVVQRGLPVLTVGGAGGRRDGTQVRVGDLGDASGDHLLRLVRKTLRREYGYAPGEQRGRMHFGVRCAWSEEPQVFPWSDGTCSARQEPGGNLRLDCASGFGAATFVTAAFGLAAAGEVVRLIAQNDPAS